MEYTAHIIAANGKILEKNTLQQIADELGAMQPEISANKAKAKINCRNKVNISAKYEVDILYAPKLERGFKLLVCDMESTIIRNEFLDEIADYLGIGKKVEEITARAMNGELNFQESLFARIELVKGLKLSEAEQIIKARLKYNRGAKELVQGCKTKGIYTMLVSGGFTLFTEVVAKHLGFDEHHANNLVFKDGILQTVAEPILGKEAKLEITKAKCEGMEIGLENVITVGDGANDLPMLNAAGLGVCYYGKQKVKAEVFSQINYGDLSTILAAI